MLKKISLTILTLAVACLTPVYGTDDFEKNLSVTDQNRLLGAVARDWMSTSIREWLNSDSKNVLYTAKPPSYKDEAGFLSDNNFTSTERNAIAITRHGAGWQYSVEGNISQTLYYSLRSLAHNDYIFNDKVFLLHYTDLVNFVEKNGEAESYRTKYYSNYIQNTTNKRDSYPYTVNTGYYNAAYTNNSILLNSMINYITPYSQNNIAPALSLKPEFYLSNGIQAKNLKLGERVLFGRYNGEPIEWIVINKSDQGYPLLWSTRIITVKEYDIGGDLNPSTSNYINFDTHDVDLVSGNGQAKSWETSQAIDSTTSIRIDNESALVTPTNSTSITVTITAEDTKYPIRKIILPTGEEVKGNVATWTLTDNGEFDIIAENSIGVTAVRHIVTKAINTPAEVLLTTDNMSGSKWSNKPVNIFVSASNNGIYESVASGNREMGYSTSTAKMFPEWMPLGGKRVRITGTLKNALSDSEASRVDMNACVIIRTTLKLYSTDRVSYSYPIFTQHTLQELKDKGSINIDMVYTLPPNTYGGVHPNVSLMSGNSDYMRPPYNYWMSDFKFEILDKDDLKIEEITMPDKSVVYKDSVKYTATKDGVYSFSVKDNRGKITTKSTEVRIDTVTPRATHTINPSGYTRDSTSINLNTLDDLSGIRSIKLPNGEVRRNIVDTKPLSTTYNVSTNGNYSFEIEDFAGNKFVYVVPVTTIDKEPPVISITPSTSSWTNKPVNLLVSASDSLSGVRNITLPGENIVSGSSANYAATSNSTYAIYSIDIAGNKSVKNISVSNIDTVAPTANVVAPEKTTNRRITVSISNIYDNLSGALRVRVSTNADFSGASYIDVSGKSGITVPIELPRLPSGTENYSRRTIYVELEDRAGNKLTKTMSVKYEANKPNAPVIKNKNNSYASPQDGMSIEWIYLDTNNDPSSLAQQKAIVSLKNSKGVVVKKEIIGSSTKFAINDLDVDTYTVSVEVFNTDNKSSKSDEVIIRYGVRLGKGVLTTKPISASSDISYIQVVTNHGIPDGTKLSGSLYYTTRESSHFDSSKKIDFELTTGKDTSKIIRLPVKCSSIKLEYTLDGHETKENLSPYVDSVSVFAK